MSEISDRADARGYMCCFYVFFVNWIVFYVFFWCFGTKTVASTDYGDPLYLLISFSFALQTGFVAFFVFREKYLKIEQQRLLEKRPLYPPSLANTEYAPLIFNEKK